MRERSALLGAQTRPVDLHRVAAFTQAAQERLGQGPIAEKALPFRIGEVRRDEGWPAVMALFHELEEDVGLFGFRVDIAQFVDLCGAPHKSIHVANSVMLT